LELALISRNQLFYWKLGVPQMKKNFVMFICTLILLIPQMVIAEWGFKVGSNYSFLKEPAYGEPGVDVMYGL
jgi:hypothetical protein